MNLDRVFFDRFEHHFNRINDELQKCHNSSLDIVNEIGGHSLLGQGKRLRPLLFILSGNLCGYEAEDVYRLSTIFECIHTGSLLHDDVLANAETRRKKPAAREVWGNQASVLGGDFLYSKAIETALSSENSQILNVLNRISLQMVEGQFLELNNTNNWHLDKKDYMSIIISKTAVLMSAACACGAIAAGVDHAAVDQLNGFGLNLGIAFQLMDDVLDYTSCEEEFGKPVGKDLMEGKITLPLIYALSGVDKSEIQRLENLFTKRKALPGDYAEVIDMVRKGKAIDRIRSEAKEYVVKAARFLDFFPALAVKEDLLALNEYIVERRF